MNPTDELAAAARLLRDTAATATPGPWGNCSTDEDGAWPVFVVGQPAPDGDRGEPVLVVHQTVDEEIVGPGDVAWIALASPALAEPIAAWLEGITRRHNLSPDLYNECIWCVEPWPCPDLRDALAVARAINGGAT